MEWNKDYYKGKIAAVTGAASGVGLALCELLLDYGAKAVTLADFDREALDRETARLSEAYPGKVAGVLCDVTSQEQVFAFVKRAADLGGGRLDLLINCAGAGLQGKFLFEPDGTDPDNAALAKVLTNEDWEKGFALNFSSAVYGCRAAVPLMIAQGGGQIVNIASGITFSPMAYQSLYAATKAALAAFSYAIRGELHPYGVKVNTATPGTTATGIFKRAGLEAPPNAQPPQIAAEKILAGAAENRRLTLGDKSDEEGAVACFLPDDMGRYLDQIFASITKMRREGKAVFTTEKPKIDPTPLFVEASAISQTKDLSQFPEVQARIAKYAALRKPTELDASYYAGKTAAVTGGASGVGFALCKKLLECGAKKVALADYNKEALEKKEAELNGLYPGKAKGFFCNVADEDSVKEMIGEAAEWFDGSFDLLINCAGVGQMGLTFAVPDAEEVMERTHLKVETPENWKRLFAIDFAGPMYGCRAVLPLMLKQGSGQIVNIISGYGLFPTPYQALYSAAKAALNMATLSLRCEFALDGVKLCSASPGVTATAIFDHIGMPEGAQSPETSALRILTGAARNDRLIPGDDTDMSCMFFAHNPYMAGALDMISNEMAASRKGGATADFGAKK